jgi:hypothetical protein
MPARGRSTYTFSTHPSDETSQIEEIEPDEAENALPTQESADNS